MTEEIHRLIRFVHLDVSLTSKSTIPADLVDILPANAVANYHDVTNDSEHKPSASSVFALCCPRLGSPNKRTGLLLSACHRLSLFSTLDSQIRSAVTRWFSSVVAFIGTTGLDHQFALSHHNVDACFVQLGDRSMPADVKAHGFETLISMLIAALGCIRYDDNQLATRAMLSEGIASVFVEQLLPVTIPNSVTGLLSYTTVTQQITEITKFFVKFEVGHSSADRLSQWCADINEHFLRSVRLVTLDRCRDHLINNDYKVYHADQPAALSSALSSYPPLFFPSSLSPYLTATAAVNMSSLTPTPEPVAASPVQLLPIRLQARVLSSYLASCSPISLCACLYSATLFELLGQSLHAYTVSPELCFSLLSTLCDCILLVLSIPGVHNSDQLQSVGYMSWLYASDCSYLAVCVERMAAFIVTECRLTPISSASFFPSIGGTAPELKFASEAAVRLLALVEPLRAVSQHWKRHTLTQLTSAVITSLDSLPAFTSLDSPNTLRTTLSSLQQTIHTITRSLRSLKDVERLEGRQLIGRRLVERLCDAVVDRVLAVEDVGIEEAKGMEQAVAAVNCGEVRELIGSGWDGRAWRRLEAVQLLIGSEQTLVKIESEWEAGMLSVLDAVEVCGWIRALYQDSANRQRLLQKISGRK